MISEVIHTEKETGRTIREGVFYFHPDDGIYGDHFPGYPVVPGSVIVHAFLRAAQEAGISEECVTLENFRFREFLTPGRYPFRIECLENRLNCRIYRGDKILVTGILVAGFKGQGAKGLSEIHKNLKDLNNTQIND